MLPLESIQITVDGMKKYQAEASSLQMALDAEIARIKSDGTRHADYIREKVSEARAKAQTNIFPILGKIKSEGERLNKEISFWGDKKFLLSLKPLTDGKDAGIEAISRLAKMTELSKMGNTHLRLAAEAAKKFNRYGELHLLSLENSSRDPKSPNWESINLDDVVLDDQNQALALISEGRKIQNAVPMQFKEATGQPVTPMDKLTAARGGV